MESILSFPESNQFDFYNCHLWRSSLAIPAAALSSSLWYLTIMAPKVLIVCLGNICRSPMGEAVLRKVAKDREIDILVDSAGTGAYHLGEEPDER